MNTYSIELVRRCRALGMCAATTTAAGILGLAIDAGIISLGEMLDLVRSCSTADELGDALCMLAATVTAEPAGVVP